MISRFCQFFINKFVKFCAICASIALRELFFTIDIIVDGEHICGPKDLGIELKQINKLKKLQSHGKINKILIKEGIPFVPSFLAAYITILLFGNWLSLLV